MNRGRDSRSVEPQGFMDKYQGKPPTGRRMNDGRKDGNMSKGWKLEQLPPRFQKKFLEQNGYPPNTPIAAIDDSWDGNGLSFQVRHLNYFLFLHDCVVLLFVSSYVFIFN